MAPRGRVQITFQDNPDLQDTVERISVNLVRIEAGEYRCVGRVGERKRVRKSNRWRLILPKKIHRANTLDLFARFKQGGDASHSIGLHPRRRRTPGQPRSPAR